jgi:hypothetical protein
MPFRGDSTLASSLQMAKYPARLFGLRARVRATSGVIALAHVTRWTDVGCIVDVQGEMTNEELRAINGELTGSARFEDLGYFVRDLTGVTRQSLALDELTCAAYTNWAASAYNKELRGAFVVGDAATLARVDYYIQQSQQAGCRWELKVFSNFAAALAWAEADCETVELES